MSAGSGNPILDGHSFTTPHYGGRKWMEERLDARRGGGRSSAGSGNGNGASVVASSSSSSASSAPTFAQQPNPHVHSVEQIISPLSSTQLAVGVTALAASVVLYQLYRRWTRKPDHPSLKKRARLSSKFVDVEREAGQQPVRRSWLWRVFFTEPKPKTVRGRHSRSSLGRSPSPRSLPASPSAASASPSSSLSPPPRATPSSSPPLPHLSGSGSGSEHYRAFLLECNRLAERGIVIANPTAFYLKRQRMRDSNIQAMRASPSGCESNIHILTTFDRTLTTLHEAPAPPSGLSPSLPPPAPCATSQSLLDHFLPSSYASASRKLFEQYYPLETSRHLAPEARAAFMQEWWSKQHALLALDEYKLTRNRIAHMARTTLQQGRLRLRTGVTSLLHQPDSVEEAAELSAMDALCARFDIPMLIFSGSMHDMIEELLLCHGVRVHNSNRAPLSEMEQVRCARSNVHLLANPLRWGAPKPSAAHRVASSAHASPSASPLQHHAVLSPPGVAGGASSSSLLSPGGSASVCLGFDQRFLVHSLNKCYERVLEQPVLLRQLERKSGVILLGSTLQDVHLVDGIERKQAELARLADEDAQHAPFALDAYDAAAALPAPAQPAVSVGEVLRFGFLNSSSGGAERLAAFKAAYDVVILHDGDMEFVRSTLAYVCGVEQDVASSHHQYPAVLPPPSF